MNDPVDGEIKGLSRWMKPMGGVLCLQRDKELVERRKHHNSLLVAPINPRAKHWGDFNTRDANTGAFIDKTKNGLGLFSIEDEAVGFQGRFGWLPNRRGQTVTYTALYKRSTNHARRGVETTPPEYATGRFEFTNNPTAQEGGLIHSAFPELVSITFPLNYKDFKLEGADVLSTDLTTITLIAGSTPDVLKEFAIERYDDVFNIAIVVLKWPLFASLPFVGFRPAAGKLVESAGGGLRHNASAFQAPGGAVIMTQLCEGAIEGDEAPDGVEQVYDAASTNAMSGVAVAEALEALRALMTGKTGAEQAALTVRMDNLQRSTDTISGLFTRVIAENAKMQGDGLMVYPTVGDIPADVAHPVAFVLRNDLPTLYVEDSEGIWAAADTFTSVDPVSTRNQSYAIEKLMAYSATLVVGGSSGNGGVDLTAINSAVDTLKANGLSMSNLLTGAIANITDLQKRVVAIENAVPASGDYLSSSYAWPAGSHLAGQLKATYMPRINYSSDVDYINNQMAKTSFTHF